MPWTLKLRGRRSGAYDDGMRVVVVGTYLTVLSAMALIWFEKQYSCLPSFTAVMAMEPVD